LRGGPSVDLDAGEGCGLAAAAGLEGFELVEVLEKHAVEVGLVPYDAVDAGGEGERAEGLDERAGVLGRDLFAEGFELFEEVLGGTEGIELIGDDAVKAPGGEGDAVGENQLGVADGVEGVDVATEVGLPILLALNFGQDGQGGENPVPEGADGVAGGEGGFSGPAASGDGGVRPSCRWWQPRA